MKEQFIDNEIWILTFGGGFQRTGIYKKGVGDKSRRQFRNKIKIKTQALVEKHYKEEECSSQNHIGNLIEFSEWTKENFSQILNEGKLNLGVTQKLINLHLKYLWCLGRINRPPHCPFDRIVISKLMKSNMLIAWTKIEKLAEYENLVNLATQKAGQKSIAEWELEIFSRRN